VARGWPGAAGSSHRYDAGTDERPQRLVVVPDGGFDEDDVVLPGAPQPGGDADAGAATADDDDAVMHPVPPDP
jgi:hypothetical protein